MGKGWDHGVPGVEFWKEMLRVAKPGAHLVAFGGTRTFHRMVCAIEDAGWEVRDCLMWLYGQGFPKNKDLGNGWGSALKPAWEPIVLARKPFDGSLERNHAARGVGGLNIDGCRIVVTDEQYARNCSGDRGHAGTRSVEQRGATDLRPGGGSAAPGRWPANVAHDGSDEVVQQFPAQAGAAAAAPVRTRKGDKFRGTYGAFKGNVDEQGSTFQGDSGSAARFFYCPKATRADRDEGLDGFEKKPLHWSAGDQNPGSFQSAGTDKSARNHHPTVKPVGLMRWLCRLVTPAGGLVLDPFVGSGSTGKAAVLEGFNFVGIEQDEQYLEIARTRIAHAQKAA